MPSPISQQPKPNAIENEICSSCAAIFSSPTAITELVSERGLEYIRERNSLLRSALAGCKLCRELLCIPHSYTYPNDRPDPSDRYSTNIDVRSISDDNFRSWPLAFWGAALAVNGEVLGESSWLHDLSSNGVYGFYFRGKPSTKSYIEVSLSPRGSVWYRSLLLSISCPLCKPKTDSYLVGGL